MTTFAFPSLTPNTSEWSLDYNTATFVSPMSGQVQTLELPGARWHCVFGFINLTQAQMKALSAFLIQLRGGSNRFTAYNKSNPLTGGMTGTPAVKTQAVAGVTSMDIKSCPIDTQVFNAGDMFSIAGELKMVTADITSDGSGDATVTFEPPLRVQAAVDVTIDYGTSATGIFRLINDSVPFNARPGRFYSVTIEGVESF